MCLHLEISDICTRTHANARARTTRKQNLEESAEVLDLLGQALCVDLEALIVFFHLLHLLQAQCFQRLAVGSHALYLALQLLLLLLHLTNRKTLHSVAQCTFFLLSNTQSHIFRSRPITRSPLTTHLPLSWPCLVASAPR